MSKSCQICGNSHNNKFHTLKEMMFGTGHLFEYLECNECGTIQQLPFPSFDLSAYYPYDYYAYVTLNHSSNFRKFLKIIRWQLYSIFDIKLFRPLWGDWIKRGNVQLNDKIADIGCGNGQLLMRCMRLALQTSLGADPFIESTQRINSSLLLLKNSIFEIDDTFDFIMMHHSFEHMDEPKKALEKANQLLKPGKQLLIRIPVAGGRAWEMYGRHWAQLDAPRHIFIHSVKSMKLLAEQTGFEVSQIIYDSDAYQFWASEAIKKGVPSTKAKGTFSEEEMKAFNIKAQQLNEKGEGDQACFYLTKR